jgi:hypothetical protein
MTRNDSLAWLLAAAVCLSSCGGSTTSQYEDPPAARPDGLSYSDPNLFIEGVAITPLVPTVRGNPSSYYVVPDLPAGLVMDNRGVISGTPAEPKSPETYLVTASNAAGDSLFGIRITVLGRFSIGGLVTGLTGTGLVLTNNGADNLAVNANGPFMFAREVPASSSYNVVVTTQPTGQTCSVAGGSGALTNANYDGVTVTCTTNVTKAAGFGSMVLANTGGIQYLTCFYPPLPGFVRGYVVEPVTGMVTMLGDLIYRSDAVSETRWLTGCEPRLVTMDPSGMWVTVIDEETEGVSVYATAL